MPVVMTLPAVRDTAADWPVDGFEVDGPRPAPGPAGAGQGLIVGDLAVGRGRIVDGLARLRACAA
jgi:hypothetical protein